MSPEAVEPSRRSEAPALREPDPRRETLLEIVGMSKRFGETVALDRLSLDIASGEFFTIIGPSGSGKTTLLRILGGFEVPDESERFDLAGMPVANVPAHRRNVATVFQHYALFPHMSVGKNVEYGLKVRGISAEERRDRARKALRSVQLEHMYDRSVGTLSGGERQRVAVARAIIVQPALLLLDEPLGALDEKLRSEMQFELKQLQQSLGITFVYVTHNQDEALTMSDRMAVLHGGKLQQLASPEEVYSRPRTKFVADFMGAANFLAAELVDVSGGVAHARYRDHTFSGEAPDNLAGPGAEVWIAVRPEHVRASTRPSQEAPSLLAKVQRSAYRGAYTETTGILDDGTAIVARLSDDSGGYAPGTEVYLTFDPQATVILAG